MLIKGEKYACDACVRGHRVSSCQHQGKPPLTPPDSKVAASFERLGQSAIFSNVIRSLDHLTRASQRTLCDTKSEADDDPSADRPLVHINKKGRPVSQCPHCRGLRKARAQHVKCDCAEKAHSKEECPYENGDGKRAPSRMDSDLEPCLY
jgi:Copper fist DNA binding domain